MSNLLQDPMFLYAVAFIIFVALAFIYGRKPALQWIDGEIAHIRSELDSARELRAEAEAALAECKAKQARAEDEARLILATARRDAETLRQQAETDLAAALVRHQQMAAERIRLAEGEAIETVRKAAIDAALAIARKSLRENLADDAAAQLVDQAIDDMQGFQADKARAA